MSWNVIGHTWVVDLLQAHLAGDQVRHAYLFVGPEGVGKHTLAARFTQAVLCESPVQPGELCGTCPACRRVLAGSHPDVHTIVPEAHGEALKVDQIRQLQRQIVLAPYAGGRRVVIFPDFGQASRSAANAMLKTLEEPPDPVILLLCAASRESLLETIVSRCETLSLRPVAVGTLMQALQQRGASSEQAQLLATVSAGLPGRALQYLESPHFIEQREGRLSDLQTLLNADRRKRFAIAEQMAKGKDLAAQREEVQAVLQTWLSWWRDSLLLALGLEVYMHNPDQRAELESLTARVRFEKLWRALQATRKTIEAIDQYANLRLALETMLIEWP
jgi:DNA polymerase-3 subunit delta'